MISTVIYPANGRGEPDAGRVFEEEDAARIIFLAENAGCFPGDKYFIVTSCHGRAHVALRFLFETAELSNKFMAQLNGETDFHVTESA